MNVPMSSGGRDSRDNKGPDKRRRFQVRKKVCRFCVDKTPFIDYKDIKTLRFFMTERGKILPRRISGNCARHQREVTVAVQRAQEHRAAPVLGREVSADRTSGTTSDRGNS